MLSDKQCKVLELSKSDIRVTINFNSNNISFDEESERHLTAIKSLFDECALKEALYKAVTNDIELIGVFMKYIGDMFETAVETSREELQDVMEVVSKYAI